MTNGIVLYDRRLGGTFLPSSGIHALGASEGTTLVSMALGIRRAVHDNGNSPIPRLTIMAHGTPLSDEGITGVAARGNFGFVIQLGEGLHLHNVNDFCRLIRGQISERIRLMVCGPVRYRDGQILCSRLAQNSGVPVFASSSNQDFSLDPSVSVGGFFSLNFGAWEGHVFEFSPETGQYRTVFVGPDAQNYSD